MQASSFSVLLTGVSFITSHKRHLDYALAGWELTYNKVSKHNIIFVGRHYCILVVSPKSWLDLKSWGLPKASSYSFSWGVWSWWICKLPSYISFVWWSPECCPGQMHWSGWHLWFGASSLCDGAAIHNSQMRGHRKPSARYRARSWHFCCCLVGNNWKDCTTLGYGN